MLLAAAGAAFLLSRPTGDMVMASVEIGATQKIANLNLNNITVTGGTFSGYAGVLAGQVYGVTDDRVAVMGTGNTVYLVTLP